MRKYLRSAGIILRRTCGVALVFAASSGFAFAGGPAPVPEIDPGSVLTGLTLFVGGLLMITDRMRRR